MKRLLTGLIRAYQLLLSPVMPPRCIHQPTCSRYALEAIERHGVIRGVLLSIRRLLHCHPFSRGGYDPVP
jgi:hypothetical protein